MNTSIVIILLLGHDFVKSRICSWQRIKICKSRCESVACQCASFLRSRMYMPKVRVFCNSSGSDIRMSSRAVCVRRRKACLDSAARSAEDKSVRTGLDGGVISTTAEFGLAAGRQMFVRVSIGWACAGT